MRFCLFVVALMIAISQPAQACDSRMSAASTPFAHLVDRTTQIVLAKVIGVRNAHDYFVIYAFETIDLFRGDLGAAFEGWIAAASRLVRNALT